jgi:hypothetical protein
VPGVRVLGRHLDGLVEVGALQQVEAEHLLLRLRERAIGDQHVAAADADGGAVGRRPQAVADQPDTATVHLGHPVLDGVARLVLRRHLVAVVTADQEHVLHLGSLLVLLGRSPLRQPASARIDNPPEKS